MNSARKAVKVLQIVGSMNQGGVETWLLHLLRYFDRREIAMDFLCLSGEAGAYGEEIANLGGHIHLIPLDRRRPDHLSRQFLQLLRQERYQVIHSHVLTFSGFLLSLARVAGIPKRIAHFHTSTVTTEGQTDNLWRHLYVLSMKALLRINATRLLAGSQVAMEAVWGPAWRRYRNAEILYNGIDLSVFRQATARQGLKQELGIPEPAKVIGHVGRFVPAKNHQFIVKIADKLIKRRKDIRFLLIGDGPLRSEIERQVQQLHLNNYFVFTGLRNDVPALMKIMNLFLFTSTREGLGNVLIEAQAAGLPLVTSQLPAFREVVVTPWHQALPFEELDAWVHACETMLDNSLTQKVPPSVQMELEKFSVHNCLRRLTEIYLQ